jgi:uncharacterized protein (UPF0276 family)
MKASDGHFWADGEVNGARVRFLVDTGATAVALTPADAERLGIDLKGLKYGYTLARLGAKPTLIEWDQHLPDFAVLEDEARLATEHLDVVAALAA